MDHVNPDLEKVSLASKYVLKRDHSLVSIIFFPCSIFLLPLAKKGDTISHNQVLPYLFFRGQGANRHVHSDRAGCNRPSSTDRVNILLPLARQAHKTMPMAPAPITAILLHSYLCIFLFFQLRLICYLLYRVRRDLWNPSRSVKFWCCRSHRTFRYRRSYQDRPRYAASIAF